MGAAHEAKLYVWALIIFWNAAVYGGNDSFDSTIQYSFDLATSNTAVALN